jgi:integrase
VPTVLTPRFVAVAKPKRNDAGEFVRTEYPDAGCPGLYLIVQPSGSRSWAFRFCRRGKTGKKTLGNADEGGMTLAAARHGAADLRHRLEQGLLPPVTAVTPVTPKMDGGGDRIETAIAAFLELHVQRKNRPSSARHVEGILNKIVLPAWRGRTIGSILRRDVIDLVDSVVAKGYGVRANRTVNVLSKLFNWLMARDILVSSPVTGVERPHKEQIRTRVLTDEELRALWLACEHEGVHGQAIRMLILTGGRRDEVGEMRWSEIDEDLWTLPPKRTKNGREHVVPLSAQALALIEARPRFADCPFVFSADGKGAPNNWAKVKRRISAKAGVPADTWRLHDLRRTAASGMQKLAVSVPVIEKALNHFSGTFRGIVGVYQQHDYADEIRVALQKWADHVEEIVGGKPAKVFTLRGKRG